MHTSKQQHEEINRLLLHFMKTIYLYERREIAEYDLSFQEMYILQHLKASGRRSIAELAQELEVPHFTASRLVSRLGNKGFAKKEKDPADQRMSLASISKEGVRITEAIEETHTTNILKNIEKYPDLDINVFIETAKYIHMILKVKGENDEKSKK